jgi:ATP-dependent RNA helicase RhlB
MSDATPPATEAGTDNRPLTDVCFENFALHPLLLKGLEEARFVRCTPIQAMALPKTLEGKDIAGQAQTGTGKTLAFLVTIMNRLLSTPARADRKASDPRAVVLAPTRELAIQIEKDAQVVSRYTGLRFALIYGGVDYDKQRELLRSGTDVIIATPGRIIDYYKQHVFGLGSVDIVVLDEADRMFDLGFIKDIRFLLRRMPAREERQSLLFSATLSHRVLELAYEHMNEAEKIVVETDFITADRVRQVVYFPSNDEKIPLLIGLLSRMDAQRTIVFVNTKAWVERVGRALERAHFTVGVLSGDVPQPKRERLLAKFKRGELEILVATDVAARGLHIPDVSHVFNFDLPFDAEDYVHRIGRTARLGAEGDAISFACELYAMSLPDIEQYIDQKIPVEAVDPAMLLAVPRTAPARPVVAEVEVDSAADDARATKGPPPKADSRGGRERRPGGRSDGRHGGARREGGGRRDDSRGGRNQGGRGERPASGGHAPAHARDGSRPAAARHEPPRPPATAARPADAAREAGEGGKRRRRRRGRGRGAEGTVAAETAAIAASAPKPAEHETHGGGHERPRFLGRIKQGLKAFVNKLRGPGRH